MNHRVLIRAWIGMAVIVGFLCGNAALADEIRYLAWDGQHARAVVETAGGARAVSLGDEVSGFGTVIELDPSHIVLRRFLSAAERADLERRGLIGHRAELVEVIRWDLRFHGISVE